MFEFTSIEQFHAQLKEGKITCEQVIKDFFVRIDAHKHLNAFIEVFTDEALSKAKEIDLKLKQGLPLGRLHGVIIGIKDVIAYKGHGLSAASNILKNFKSVYSATAVERLLAEDAIIIGRLNCDEFAMGSSNENSAYGKVLNAADTSRVPGGSSGGSAVAVQAGMCMASLGSDTGGSVRQPADFCGVIGLKPTYGRISRYGLIAYASSFDQIGIFGKTIHDVALLLEVMAGQDDFDSTVSHKKVPEYSSLLQTDQKFRFAYLKEALEHPGIDPEIAALIKSKIENLREEGHTVKEVDFNLIDYVVPAYYVLTTAEASSNLSRYDGVRYGYRTDKKINDINNFYKESRSEGFGREVKRRIMLGTFVLSAGYFDAYYTRAQKVRQILTKKTLLIFKEFDFVILPTTPVPAFRIGEKMTDPTAMYLADIYTVMANLTGCPAISLPIFSHSSGVPTGLQIMSNQFDEVPLLRISNRLLS